MSKNCYPALLTKQATLLGSLTRIDLLILGISYLILAKLQVSGIYSLLIIATILFFIRLVKGKFPTDFLKYINGDRLITSGDIQKIIEKEGLL